MRFQPVGLPHLWLEDDLEYYQSSATFPGTHDYYKVSESCRSSHPTPRSGEIHLVAIVGYNGNARLSLGLWIGKWRTKSPFGSLTTKNGLGIYDRQILDEFRE
ncbi:hypothetical protein ASPCAL07723 [Aspergillus calidoustus]|uniref:Uncharacterized protein n=1 Tax=Aspergillus calidoustus TaxID=454130 RepID=A0A0U5CPJ2_ASPCI|nr:hypothetical protein ASPCAL07723 [Aspergillus calidoustus]